MSPTQSPLLNAFSFSQTLGTFLVWFTDPTVAGQVPPIQIESYGNISTHFYTNNQFKQLATQIVLIVPSVVTGTAPIPMISYWITDPRQATPTIPNPPYTENMTATYPGLVGDPRIVI